MVRIDRGVRKLHILPHAGVVAIHQVGEVGPDMAAFATDRVAFPAGKFVAKELRLAPQPSGAGADTSGGCAHGNRNRRSGNGRGRGSEVVDQLTVRAVSWPVESLSSNGCQRAPGPWNV